MSIVVLSTTTLFKIATKKEEIELLKLLGASNFYIRRPYLMESLVLSLLASLCSFLATVIALLNVRPALAAYLENIPTLVVPIQNFMVTVWPVNATYLALAFTITSFFSICIAIIASFIATQRYIK